MLLSELATELRQDILEDWNEHNASDYPYKWSDTKILRYFNEAIQEACLRAPLYQSTATFSVVSGTSSYTLDKEVRQIDRVNLAAVTYPLTQFSEAEMDAKYGAIWRDDTGTPLAYSRKDDEIILYPEPIAADTMTVLHYRLPDRLYAFGEEPPIPYEHHRCLLYWAAYKAFMSPDIDLGNMERALSFLALFEGHFGKRRDARVEHLNINTPKHHRATPVRMA